MGILDLLSEDAQEFNRLLENYPEATKEIYHALLDCGAINRWGPDRYDVSEDVPVRYKRILVEHKSDVLELNKYFAEDHHREEIIKTAGEFPRAYLYFCRNENVSSKSVYKLWSQPDMPGEQEFSSFDSLNHKTAFDHDDHFQQLVTAELKKNGFLPRLPLRPTSKQDSIFELNLYSLTSKQDSITLTLSPFDLCLSEGKRFISLVKERPKDKRWLISLSSDNHTIRVKEFKEDENISKLYKHLPEFPEMERILVNLIEREKKWKKFENDILGDKYAQQYYRAFFYKKYDSEIVDLDKYELLIDDKTPLNEFIEFEELRIADRQQQYPYGLNEFIRSHPDTPRSDYCKHTKTIKELNLQSKYVLFPERQTKLNEEIISLIQHYPEWETLSYTIDCAKQSFSGDIQPTSCTCAYVLRYLIYDRQFYDMEENDFKYCEEVTSNGKRYESLTPKQILYHYDEILSGIMDIYFRSYTRMRIIICDDLMEYLENWGEESALTAIQKLDSIKSYTNMVEVLSLEAFRKDAADHIPHLFLTMRNGSWPLYQMYFWTLLPNYIISSVISLGVDIGGMELQKYNERKRKEEEHSRLDEINEMRAAYPDGFLSFCISHGIDVDNRDQLLKSFSTLSKNEPQIIGLQHDHNERLLQEERQRREKKCIERAQSIADRYPSAIKDVLPRYSGKMSFTDAELIISKEAWMEDREILYHHRDELFVHQRNVACLPHQFFYDYYPKNRYPDYEITKESDMNRSFIWSFKDGKSSATQKAIDLVVAYLREQKIASFKDKITLVCIPASDSLSNTARFKSFAEGVCSELGFRNGFEHIRITKEAEPKRLGGVGLPEIEIEDAFFNGSYVLLFDDLVTSGRSVAHYSGLLKRKGATCIGVISLGQTV